MSRHYVNDYGITVYAYQTARGGVYHSEQVAETVAGEMEAIHALVRFIDVADDVADGRRVPAIREAIREYYAALQAGRDARVARDVAFLAIEEAMGMSPAQWIEPKATTASGEPAETQAAPQQGWQPIGTAPKDGRVLLWGRYGEFIGQWGDYQRYNSPQITHWAPPPAAPQDKDQT